MFYFDEVSGGCAVLCWPKTFRLDFTEGRAVRMLLHCHVPQQLVCRGFSSFTLTPLFTGIKWGVTKWEPTSCHNGLKPLLYISNSEKQAGGGILSDRAAELPGDGVAALRLGGSGFDLLPTASLLGTQLQGLNLGVLIAQ